MRHIKVTNMADYQRDMASRAGQANGISLALFQIEVFETLAVLYFGWYLF